MIRQVMVLIFWLKLHYFLDLDEMRLLDLSQRLSHRLYSYHAVWCLSTSGITDRQTSTQEPNTSD